MMQVIAHKLKIVKAYGIEAVDENPIVKWAHVHDCFLTVSAGRGVAAASAFRGLIGGRETGSARVAPGSTLQEARVGHEDGSRIPDRAGQPGQPHHA